MPDLPSHEAATSGTQPEADRLAREIEAALAAAPPVAIPADFASRVVALAATEPSLQPWPQRPIPLPRPRFARAATLLCTAGVLAALVAESPGLLTYDVAKATAFLWLLSAEAVLLAAALGPWPALWNSAD